METIELTLVLEPTQPWSEIAIACLADNGFDSFVENEDGVTAYSQGKVSLGEIEQLLGTTLNDAKFWKLESKMIPHQNWNAQWEENFSPVFVEDYCTIRAPFHDESIVKGMEVVIQPQMSFGTGHHQTTWLMTKLIFEASPFKNVLDMGTGTGVLAIVAEKLGAQKIIAVDIEPWSVENTQENAERNGCKNIDAFCGDIDIIQNQKFDLILANINKNVLKSHLKSYFNMLESGGYLMLSGFFETDVEDMLTFTSQFEFNLDRKEVKEGWAALVLKKK